jgi:hypothetical protein
MNIDFAHHPAFAAYVLLLMFSGLVMVFLASPAVRESKLWLRVLNAVIGLGFFGYGFYLAFLFQGGTYLIFFKAFFVPVVLVVRTVQASRAAQAQAAAVAPPAPPQQWGPQQQWSAPQQWATPEQQWGRYAEPEQQWGPPQPHSQLQPWPEPRG